MTMERVDGSNVVSLGARRLDDVFPAVNQVEAYWAALKADLPLPRRSQIDPRGIESALHQAFVLERLAPNVARFRLAGMHLADLMGMEVRGMPVTALFVPEARDMAGDALERCFTQPARVTLTLQGERSIGRGALEARMIMLPLLDEQDRVTRVLGALQAIGDIGRQPRRFSITECRAVAIEGVGASATDIPAALPPIDTAPTMVGGFAEERPQFTPAPRPPVKRGRPHLRLVKND